METKFKMSTIIKINKFNHSKSKVLVVGQRIDKNRKWYLGNGKIDETDNYKYLGVYLSFSAYKQNHGKFLTFSGGRIQILR
jgi:hypothetical protein